MKCSSHSSVPHNHSHICPSCHHKWWHSSASLNCTHCHICPQCGVQKFTIDEYSSPFAERTFLEAKLNSASSPLEALLLKYELLELKKEILSRGLKWD
jgi:hypothetical protein